MKKTTLKAIAVLWAKPAYGLWLVLALSLGYLLSGGGEFRFSVAFEPKVKVVASQNSVAEEEAKAENNEKSRP